MAYVSQLDETLEASRQWLDDLRVRLGWSDPALVWLAAISTLHALRDHLPSDEVARLGGALPPLLRGLYFEGWHPRSRPAGTIGREAFLSRIHEGMHRNPGTDPEAVSRALLALLVERMPGAEVEEIKAATPAALHGLWPA